MTQTIEQYRFDQKARRVRVQVSTVLTTWGLLARFKHWLLTQDPDTEMIVLFGVLDNQYIAEHTSIPFSDYFDPRLLQDLENELQVQVVTGDSDGLRYAFILDRGRFEGIPLEAEHPMIDNGKLMIQVVYRYRDNPHGAPAPLAEAAAMDDRMRVRRNVRALVDFLDSSQPGDDPVFLFVSQNKPDIVIIDEDEFNRSAAEHEANRQRSQRIRALLDESIEAKG